MEKDVQRQTSRRRLGRPPAPTETARRNRVVTMVTDAELVSLNALAAAANCSLSAAVHAILADHLAADDAAQDNT